jgi:hypothetical protein
MNPKKSLVIQSGREFGGLMLIAIGVALAILLPFGIGMQGEIYYQICIISSPLALVFGIYFFVRVIDSQGKFKTSVSRIVFLATAFTLLFCYYLPFFI